MTMERHEFPNLSPCEPATVTIGLQAHHFGALADAVSFTLTVLSPEHRRQAWVIVDNGLIAPEEIPGVARLLAA